LSEGGLAAAAVEMAMAGGLGIRLAIDDVAGDLSATETLFSESNTRFLVETTPENAASFAKHLSDAGVAVAQLGTIEPEEQLIVTHGSETVMDVSVLKVKEAWLKPLDW
jgi:phosphoribosylformylglycinamidine synthase